MIKTNQYVMLISSLPPVGELFEADQTPISFVKLENRLKSMLTEDDFERLQRISDLVAWVRLPMDISDREIIETANQFCASEKNPVIKKIIESFLEVQTIVSALRRKQLGQEIAPDDRSWGYGPYTPHIERNWNQPGFKLKGVFPWITKAEKLMQNDSVLELEKLMLKISFDMVSKIGAGHYFDFEAVVVYVIKWDILKRWLRYDSKLAVERFHEMTESGIGEFAQILD